MRIQGTESAPDKAIPQRSISRISQMFKDLGTIDFGILLANCKEGHGIGYQELPHLSQIMSSPACTSWTPSPAINPR
jgi:hypothetical protein